MTRIVSAIPGRIRLRDKALRQSAALEKLQEKLAAVAGVLAVSTNPATGSLLLHYDAALIDRATLEAQVDAAATAMLDGAEPIAGTPTRRRLARRFNRYSKFGMLGSLAVSMAYAAAGKKRLHAATGGLFGAFLGIHMLVHRRHLLK